MTLIFQLNYFLSEYEFFRRAAVRGAGILVFLLGITWAFGILWISEGTVLMAYLFALFNSFQGLFIFLFHCVFQKKVRSLSPSCVDILLNYTLLSVVVRS